MVRRTGIFERPAEIRGQENDAQRNADGTCHLQETRSGIDPRLEELQPDITACRAGLNRRCPVPARPTARGVQIPVVFVLDGDVVFGMVAQTSLYLQLDPGGLPPVLVVRIGYRSENKHGVASGLGQRTRHLTPSVDSRYVTMLRAAPAPFTLPADIEPGGAARFLFFIKDELVPSLAERYPIDLNDQTILGMSLGGLFVLHILFTEPTAFNRYVAASPACGETPACYFAKRWHWRILLRTFRQASFPLLEAWRRPRTQPRAWSATSMNLTRCCAGADI